MPSSSETQETRSLRWRLNRRFFYSAQSSLISTVVAFVIFAAVPVLLVAFAEMTADGTLTADAAITTTATALVAFAIAGFLFWATFLEPMRRKALRRRGMCEKGSVGA